MSREVKCIEIFKIKRKPFYLSVVILTLTDRIPATRFACKFRNTQIFDCNSCHYPQWLFLSVSNRLLLSNGLGFSEFRKNLRLHDKQSLMVPIRGHTMTRSYSKVSL